MTQCISCTYLVVLDCVMHLLVLLVLVLRCFAIVFRVRCDSEFAARRQLFPPKRCATLNPGLPHRLLAAHIHVYSSRNRLGLQLASGAVGWPRNDVCKKLDETGRGSPKGLTSGSLIRLCVFLGCLI